MTVSQLMGKAWDILLKRFWFIIGAEIVLGLICLGFVILTVLVGSLFVAGSFAQFVASVGGFNQVKITFMSNDPTQLHNLFQSLGSSSAFTTVMATVILFLLVLLVIASYFNSGFIWLLANVSDNKKPTLGDSISAGFRYAISMAGSDIVKLLACFAILIVALMMLLAGPVSGIFITLAVIAMLALTIYWLFSRYAIAVDKVGAIESLEQSWQLVAGRFWSVVGLFLIVVGISAISSLVFSLFGQVGNGLLRLVFTLIYAPYIGILFYLKYQDLKHKAKI